jgi:hypothetical protein
MRDDRTSSVRDLIVNAASRSYTETITQFMNNVNKKRNELRENMQCVPELESETTAEGNKCS